MMPHLCTRCNSSHRPVSLSLTTLWKTRTSVQSRLWERGSEGCWRNESALFVEQTFCCRLRTQRTRLSFSLFLIYIYGDIKSRLLHTIFYAVRDTQGWIGLSWVFSRSHVGAWTLHRHAMSRLLLCCFMLVLINCEMQFVWLCRKVTPVPVHRQRLIQQNSSVVLGQSSFICSFFSIHVSHFRLAFQKQPRNPFFSFLEIRVQE